MTARDMRRRVTSATMTGLATASVLVALVPLAMVLFFVLSQGLQAINWDFFTAMPMPVGETGGGMANAIIGTVMLCGIGAVMAIPMAARR